MTLRNRDAHICYRKFPNLIVQLLFTLCFIITNFTSTTCTLIFETLCFIHNFTYCVKWKPSCSREKGKYGA